MEGTGDLRSQALGLPPSAPAATRRLIWLHAAPGLSPKFASVWIKLWLGKEGWVGKKEGSSCLLAERQGQKFYLHPCQMTPSFCALSP